MTIPIIQSLVAKNGKYIVLPVWKEGDAKEGNLAHPDVYVLDTYQKWPISTKFVDGDRVFHYGYIHTDESNGKRAGVGLLNIAVELVENSSAVIHAIGDTVISLVDSSSSLNLWAGGYFMCRTHPTETYRILSSTAHASGACTVTLERGLITAIAATQAVRLNQNPYSKMCDSRNTGRSYCSVMGVLLPEAVASRYAWVQTWGPCNLIGGDEIPSGGAFLRMGQFNTDGTLVWSNPWDATFGQQLAGFIIPSTSSDNGANFTASWLIQLMIAP